MRNANRDKLDSVAGIETSTPMERKHKTVKRIESICCSRSSCALTLTQFQESLAFDTFMQIRWKWTQWNRNAGMCALCSSSQCLRYTRNGVFVLCLSSSIYRCEMWKQIWTSILPDYYWITTVLPFDLSCSLFRLSGPVKRSPFNRNFSFYIRLYSFPVWSSCWSEHTNQMCACNWIAGRANESMNGSDINIYDL